MTTFWIVIGLVAAAWIVARLVAAVRADGLGYREAPRSHDEWTDGAGLPSRPLRLG